MNKDINFSKIPSHFILIAAFMLSPILSCVVKELKYREKINGLYYDKIHRMGSILSISIKDIDTISQVTLIDFINCLENEESKKGSNTSLLDIYYDSMHIDQLTSKDLYARVHFKPDTSMYTKQRKLVLKYVKQKIEIEIEYKSSEIKCNIE